MNIAILSNSDLYSSGLSKIFAGQDINFDHFTLFENFEVSNYLALIVDYDLYDAKFSDQEGLDKLDNIIKLSSLTRNTKLIILCDYRKIHEAAKLLANDYSEIIHFPFNRELIINKIESLKDSIILENKVEFKSKASIKPKGEFSTSNEEFQKTLGLLEKVAPTKSTILITGESGTGKSLLAKYIHSLSNRRKDGFIPVHCGAIPETLVESELFGHEKGAFTGAIGKKLGKFELANEGTIFLDEIGTVSSNIQVKLLQVLQERFIQRIGGSDQINLDIRIVAATNDNLDDLVANKTFREDLLYRLKVFHIPIPPLRKRKEDIPMLCENILHKFNLEMGKGINAVSKEVYEIFFRYNWPGNIRELQNVLERAYILEDGQEISTTHIPVGLLPVERELIDISPLERKRLPLTQARKEMTEVFEKKYLTDLLIAHSGKVSRMAEEAEVSERQLHKLMSKYGIKAKSFLPENIQI